MINLKPRSISYRAVIVCFFIISSPAKAVDVFNITVTSIGVQGDNAYFTTSPPTPSNCLYSVFYINSLSTAGKYYYALLVSAYASGKQINRIIYSQDQTNACNISLINY